MGVEQPLFMPSFLLTEHQNLKPCKKEKTLVKFTEVLHNVSLPLTEEQNDIVTFQQDNALVYAARFTEKWLSENLVILMQSAARSLHLNPIEIMWGVMVHQGYKDGRQFQITMRRR